MRIVSFTKYFFQMSYFFFGLTVSSPITASENQIPPYLNQYSSKEPVECSKPNEKVAILLAAGQSNLHPSIRGTYAPNPNVLEFNPNDGKCYRFDSIFSNSVATRVGEKLLLQGPYEKVIVANFSVPESAKNWQPKGWIYQRFADGIRILLSQKLTPNYFIWELGEADTNFFTPPEEFRSLITNILNETRKLGYAGPIYVAQSTRCLMKTGIEDQLLEKGSKIRDIQKILVNEKEKIFAGPNTDVIQGNGRDWLECHFSLSGADQAAQLWVDSILGEPKKRIIQTIKINKSVDQAWLHLWDKIALNFHPDIIADGVADGSNLYVASAISILQKQFSIKQDIIKYNYNSHSWESRTTHIDKNEILPLKRFWMETALKPLDENHCVFEWTFHYDPSAERLDLDSKVNNFMTSALKNLKSMVEMQK